MFLLSVFWSHEPKDPGELLVLAGSVVRLQFQTPSSLKPLGRLQPNFFYCLKDLQERKVVQMVLVT